VLNKKYYNADAYKNSTLFGNKDALTEAVKLGKETTHTNFPKQAKSISVSGNTSKLLRDVLKQGMNHTKFSYNTHIDAGIQPRLVQIVDPSDRSVLHGFESFKM
jgi:hypothetical protein